MVQTAHNKALRAVLNVENRYPTELLHTSLEGPCISDICKYHTCCFAYRGIHDQSTSYINSWYTSSDRAVSLRSVDSLNFTRESCRTTIGQRSVFQLSYVYWSALPSEVKNAPSLNTFKKSAKLNLYPYP